MRGKPHLEQEQTIGRQSGEEKWFARICRQRQIKIDNHRQQWLQNPAYSLP